jgi:hypothetical protein
MLLVRLQNHEKTQLSRQEKPLQEPSRNSIIGVVTMDVEVDEEKERVDT